MDVVNQQSHIWVAEDTDYVVWLLQIYDAQSDETTTFGKNGAVVWMPANPIMGQTFRQIGTEYCEIMETGVTVPQLGTGLGPYTDCLKIEWTDGGPDVDIYYLAPDVGSVKEEWDNAGETNEWKLQEVAYGNTLVVDFGLGGLWQYNGDWSKLNNEDVEYLGVYSDKLIADLGSLGLWEYDGISFSRLTTEDADNTGNCMVAYGNTLMVDFGPGGLWEYDGTSLSQLITQNVDYLGVYRDKLVADLGSLGLWEYDGISFSQLTTEDGDNTGNTMIAPLLGSD